MRSDFKIDSENIWNDIQAIKNLSPLIHNITNYVVMEHTANSILAIGASPVMAHALEEVEEMSQLANSLVINIGTLSPMWIKGMQTALRSAKTKGIPVVLDPVGAGATNYRTDTARTLLTQGGISAVIGNASEIVSLDRGNKSPTKGVESAISASENLAQAKAVASNYHCIVWMSGDKELITDGKSAIFINQSDPLVKKVTGMGSVASAISAAFLAVNEVPLLACAHAAVVMNVALQLAAEKAQGPGLFKLAFIDILYNLSKNQLEKVSK